MGDSTVTSGAYIINCAAPTFSPAAGTYPGTQSVTITRYNEWSDHPLHDGWHDTYIDYRHRSTAELLSIPARAQR